MKPRPLSIKLFEFLFVLTFIVGLIDGWVVLTQFPEISVFSFGPMLNFGTLVLVLGLALLVSRKKMKTAMWVLIALTVLGSPLVFAKLNSEISTYSLIVTLFQCLLQIAGLFLLFTNASRKWLHSKQTDDHLIDTFS